jgi:riboflavin kinase / FMN adenylyltransferase
MHVVPGIDALEPAHGPLFVVVGVFDGLHRGHLYLLDHLERSAGERAANASVVTFDHHPDEIVTGSAPPLLCDPQERLERLAGAGVDVTVVQHFDVALRRTTYDAFIRRIAGRAQLAGFLMTPDSSFGYERGGTPETVAELGHELGYDVVVVPPFELDGQAVKSADIRAAIASGDLATAERLLGRPVTLTGTVMPGDDARSVALRFDLPVVLPPPGEYGARIDGTLTRARLAGSTGTTVWLERADAPVSAHRITLELVTPS